VVTCAYNAAPWIGQTLDSVFSQTFTDYEVIVIDDGSTDNTREIVQQFGDRVRLIEQPHRGIVAARNAGIASSRGELVVQLDADDLWLPTALAALVPAFDDPAIAAACADVLVWDERTPWDQCPRYWERFRRGDRDTTILDQLLQENFIPHLTCLVRRSILDRLGGYDEGASSAEDYDMWLRIALVGGEIRCLDQVHGVYRVRTGSLSSNLGAKLDAVLRVYEKVISTGRLTKEEEYLVRCEVRRRKTGYRTAAVNYLLAGQVPKARRYFWRAFAFGPYDPRNVLGLGLAWVAPRTAARLASAVRRRRALLASPGND
jgi:glycosyltransferase involved in cell wall biosynthesis